MLLKKKKKKSEEKRNAREEEEGRDSKEGMWIYAGEKSPVVMHLAAEHPSLLQIEAGSSQSACNDAVNSLLAKPTLFKGRKKKRKKKKKTGLPSPHFSTNLINT